MEACKIDRGVDPGFSLRKGTMYTGIYFCLEPCVTDRGSVTPDSVYGRNQLYWSPFLAGTLCLDNRQNFTPQALFPDPLGGKHPSKMPQRPCMFITTNNICIKFLSRLVMSKLCYFLYFLVFYKCRRERNPKNFVRWHESFCAKKHLLCFPDLRVFLLLSTQALWRNVL